MSRQFISNCAHNGAITLGGSRSLTGISTDFGIASVIDAHGGTAGLAGGTPFSERYQRGAEMARDLLIGINQVSLSEASCFKPGLLKS